MADRQQHVHAHGERPDSPSATLLRRVQTHAPNSTQVVGFLALLVSGAMLLLLTGLTLTGTGGRRMTAGLRLAAAPAQALGAPRWRRVAWSWRNT